MIFSVRHTKKILSKPRMLKKRCFKNFKPEEFIEAVRKISWFDVYMTENVDTAVEMVTQKLTDILDIMAPVKVIQVRSNYAPWLSDTTKKKIKERNEAQKKASETKLTKDWDKYKKLKNSINNSEKSEKKKWQENKISAFGSDTSSIWKNIKTWLGWSTGGPPSRLI